ncbi:hypothetical protein LCGC14_0923510 [marine sediment metagenome]|uniref:Uncharacterized protein n=1 Tax=marine sediment metagenome TaxID=412755 RepID=A0A0F9NUU1_9ZZZZ
MGRKDLLDRWHHWNELYITACKSGQKKAAKEAACMREQFRQQMDKGDQMNIGNIKTKDDVHEYLRETKNDLRGKAGEVLTNVVYKWCAAKAEKPEELLHLKVGELDEVLPSLRFLIAREYLTAYCKVGEMYIQRMYIDTLTIAQFRHDTYLTPNPHRLHRLVVGLTTNLIMEIAMQAHHLAQFEERVADEAGKVDVELIETAILNSWNEYSFHLSKGRATVVVSNVGVTLHIEPCVLKVHNLIAELLELEMKSIVKDTKYILSIDWPYLISRAKKLAGGA